QQWSSQHNDLPSRASVLATPRQSDDRSDTHSARRNRDCFRDRPGLGSPTSDADGTRHYYPAHLRAGEQGTAADRAKRLATSPGHTPIAAYIDASGSKRWHHRSLLGM